MHNIIDNQQLPFPHFTPFESINQLFLQFFPFLISALVSVGKGKYFAFINSLQHLQDVIVCNP